MLVDHRKEKLHNAIAYFVENTRFCGKTKLYKLLYFLDFEHYSKTGRNVTGLEYFAWPKGPVPVRIHEKIDDKTSDLHRSFAILKRTSANGHEMLDISPLFAFSDSHFSKRELKLIESLAKSYRDSYANDMVEETHLENLPWDQIYNQKNQRQQKIPYQLALRASEFSEIISLINDNEEFEENYR